MNLPKSRTENIVIQNLPKEVLIYDLQTNKAFCLNETSTIVFNACNGKTTFAELKSQFKLTDEIIFLTLDELKRAELLEKDCEYESPFAKMSRREVVKKVGLSSLIALPLISSLVAPTALHAQSGVTSFTCSNPGAGTSQFCASSLAGCSSGAIILCETCGASASTSGICSANSVNNITCNCGGAACSNPGASTSSFCAANFAGCSQASTLCRNCSATGSTSGICSANTVNKITCTCT